MKKILFLFGIVLLLGSGWGTQEFGQKKYGADEYGSGRWGQSSVVVETFSFTYKDTGGVVFKDTGGIVYKDY